MTDALLSVGACCACRSASESLPEVELSPEPRCAAARARMRRCCRSPPAARARSRRWARSLVAGTGEGAAAAEALSVAREILSRSHCAAASCAASLALWPGRCSLRLSHSRCESHGESELVTAGTTTSMLPPRARCRARATCAIARLLTSRRRTASFTICWCILAMEPSEGASCR
eukprot:6193183-Pleurochrysis_carterae.AAC.1